MKKKSFVLNLVFFSSKSLNIVYIQQISPQFIYFISVSTLANFRYVANFTILTVTAVHAEVQLFITIEKSMAVYIYGQKLFESHSLFYNDVKFYKILYILLV